MNRAFLVGCPRSGTTLLQTMLAQHPDVFTVPETHYFLKIRGRLADRTVGPLVSPRAAARSLDALARAAQVDRPPLARWWPTVGRYVSAFTTVMDAGAKRAGASHWLEKSPIHLHYLDEIDRAVPDAQFVHLVRDGRDVVASFVNLCEREPELWIPQLLSNEERPTRTELIRAATARWNEDVATSIGRMGDVKHFAVTYAELIEQPRATLQSIAGFLGLPYDTAMERHWESAAEVVGHRGEKEHMANTFRPLQDRRLERFQEVFSEDERADVVGLLRSGGDPSLIRSR